MEKIYDNDKQLRKNNKLNIYQFTRDLETKLINLPSNNIITNESNKIIEEITTVNEQFTKSEPLPANMSKNMIDIVNNNNNNNNNNKSSKIYNNNQQDNVYYNDIIIFTLIFILLNNNFVITLINNINNNTNINLIIRSFLFLLLLYFIKNKY